MSGTAKPNRRLLPAQLVDAESVRRDVIVRPERGTDIEEMLAPEYWAHVAKGLHPLDRIEVRPDGGQWWAEMLVHVVEPFSATIEVLKVIRFGERGGKPIAAPVGYEFRNRGVNGWCVVRLSDNTILREKEGSIEAAEAWLTAHLRKLAA